MSAARREARDVLQQLFEAGRSLSELLADERLGHLAPRDRALTRALVYGATRHWRLLNALLDGLLDRPLKPRQTALRYPLALGLLQLGWLRVPAHAAVNETVALVPAWARGLSNAILRRYQREGTPRDLPGASAAVRHSHPDWLVDALARDWPDDLDDILRENNCEAPMWLRVDPRVTSLADYRVALQAAGLAVVDAHGYGLRLDEAVDVHALPGWDQAQVWVQDAAAQQAAELLDPVAGERVLDACAAPGGKSLHLLARAPIELTCVEQDAQRARRIEANLARSADRARLVVGDVASPRDWWDGDPYDAILLDAPCSGTGVIRRHPDIKWLRRPGDIAAMVRSQRRLLEACWTLLRPGGRLLYTTCSILQAENSEIIQAFMESIDDGKVQPVKLAAGRRCGPGWQVLPGQAGWDGFFYAMLVKDQ